MAVRIDGNNDLINAADGTLTIEGISVNVVGVSTATGGYKVGSAYTVFPNGNVATAGVITASSAVLRGDANLGYEALKLLNTQHDTNNEGAAQLKFGITNSLGERNARIEAKEVGGNANDVALDFYTNSTNGSDSESHRMRIHYNGNVGLGTTVPSKLLHLSSPAPFIRLTDTDTDGPLNVDIDGASGDLILDVPSVHRDFIFKSVGQANEIARFTGDGFVGIASAIPTSGFTLDVGGDVTIGTPKGNGNTFLDQKQDGDLHLINSGRTSNGASGSPGTAGVGINRFNTRAGGTSLFRDFCVYNGKDTKVLVVDGSASSVGIGTDQPAGAFEISWEGTSTDMIMLSRPSTGGNFARMGHNTSSGTNMLDVRSEGHTRFLTGGNNERLRIDSNGKFCFGTFNSSFATNDSVANFVNAASAGTENPLLTLWNPTTAQDSRASIDFLTNAQSGTDRDGAFIRASNDGATAKAHLQFGTIKDETYAELIRFQSTGGISFNGDTGTVNALDDYEEGSFTPVLQNDGSTTYSQQNGKYTKIGNRVYFNVYIKINSHDGGSSSATGITLPFQNDFGTGVVTGTVVGNDHWDTNYGESNMTGWMGNGSTIMSFYKNSGQNLQAITVDDIGDGGEIAIAGHYPTDS